MNLLLRYLLTDIPSLARRELMNRFAVFTATLFLAMCAASASADVVVIVSAKSTVNHLTAEQVTKIFLGKTNIFPTGGNAVPVDQTEGNEARDEFYARVVHKTSSQLTAHWARIIFTGDGQPPKLLEDSYAVRKAVAGNPNFIGYIDKDAVDGSVRIILEP